MDKKIKKYLIIGLILLVVVGAFYTMRYNTREIKADFTPRETNRVVVIPPTHTKPNSKSGITTFEPFDPPAASGGR